MPNDPRDIMTSLVHPESQSDFLRERKRLREVRMRMIEETECPQAMELRDGDGKVTYSGGPFQVGRQTYSDELPHTADPSSPTGYRRPGISFIPEAASEEQEQVADQMQEVTKQYNQFSATMVRDGNGGEVALSHKSDHPAIREGETHEEWFKRVSEAYGNAEKGSAGSGSAGTDTDYLREPAVDDPSGGRPDDANGAEHSCDGATEDRVLGVADADGALRRERISGVDGSRMAERSATAGSVAEPTAASGDTTAAGTGSSSSRS